MRNQANDTDVDTSQMQARVNLNTSHSDERECYSPCSQWNLRKLTSQQESAPNAAFQATIDCFTFSRTNSSGSEQVQFTINPKRSSDELLTSVDDEICEGLAT